MAEPDVPAEASSLFVVTASGEASEFSGDFAKARLLDLKLAIREALGCAVWRQRLLLGTRILDEDDQLLSACELPENARLQLVLQQNLRELPGQTGSWVAYLHNGWDANYRDFLRLGSSVGGVGDPGAALAKKSDGRGFFKMAEAEFDEHAFREVLALGSDGEWVRVSRSDGGPIPATDAFKVGSAEGYVFLFSNGTKADSSGNRTNASLEGRHWERFGPFFDDCLFRNALDGSGWQWMWAEDRDDRGTVLGSGHFVENVALVRRGYAWTWYGRARED